MRFGSVCSGIEAASVAWEHLGWKAAWVAEIDVPASAVLAHRLGATAPRFMPNPNEPGLPAKEMKARRAAVKAVGRIEWGDRLTNWGDMTRLPDLIRAGDAEAPDVLCGGTPCQSFSVAGARKGLADERGNLTLVFIDIADEIDRVRAARGEEPSVIFWENVPGVLTSKDNAFGCFLAGLAGEDVPLDPPGGRWTNAGVVLGPERAVAWRVLDAQHFGVAQRRRRVFVVASAREGFDPAAVLFEFEGVRRDSPPSREAREDLAGTLDARTTGGGFPGSDGACANHVVPHGRGSVRVRSDGTQPLYYQHDWAHGRVYGIEGVAPAVTCGNEAGGKNVLAPTWWDGSPVSQTPDAVLHKGQTMPEKNRFPAMLQPVAVSLRGREGGATAELGDEVAGCLRASGGGGDKPHVLAFSCKDYGADAAQDVAPTMRAMGHSGSHANAGGQIAVCVTGDVTHTLKAEGFDASEDGTGRGQPIVIQERAVADTNSGPGGKGWSDAGVAYTLEARHHVQSVSFDMAVRRLMPVECERLQGFPDNWTFVPVGKKMAADGPRYKQLGNSWAVPCVTWIGRRIDAHVRELESRELQLDPFLLWLIAA